MTGTNSETWVERAARLGGRFAERAKANDLAGTFVRDNYAELKREGFLAAAIPTELGGGGASFSELCELLRELGRHCGSTALALSMHQHLVAANIFRFRHGQPAEALLRRVVSEQLVLVSTGAGDWLQSNGDLTRVEGGYSLSATKSFGSGSPVGDLMITSAVYADPKEGEQVFHFAVPFKAQGVTLLNDWDTLGMRGTGSHTMRLDAVFVPEQSISLRRPRKGWHPSWSLVGTIAPPVYMAPYLGVAEAACQLALSHARKRPDDPCTQLLVGHMQNALCSAQLAHRALIDNVANYDFSPELERANRAFTYKTLTTQGLIAAVDKAMEVVGGAGLFRSFGMERLLRDARAAHYHPMQETKQLSFSGRLALGLSPLAE